MDFYNIYSQGFARVAACTHHAAIGEPAANAASVLRLARQCHDEGVALAVFPELTLSGYSIEDILLQDVLLNAVEEAVRDVVAASADLLPILVVGAPLRYRHRIYNAAVVIHRGAVLGVAPKSYLPTYREFYERRQIAPGDDERGTIRVAGVEAPFGPDLLFEASDVPGFVLHVEICEDMFVPIPPSAEAALAGATVLANLSGSPITIGRADDRSLLARSASHALPGRLRVRRCRGGRVDHRPGVGRPDHGLGERRLLAESERFPKGERLSVADVDLELLRAERLRMGTFDDNRRHHRTSAESFRRDRISSWTRRPVTSACGATSSGSRSCRPIANRLQQDCYEAYNIQVAGLEQRLRAIGLSEGGHRGLRRARLHARADRRRARRWTEKSGRAATSWPSPCPASRPASTPSATRSSCVARSGSRSLRSTSAETASLMLTEMDHPFSRGEKVYDVTFENVQAGLRTDYLFRLANQRGGIVLGTGDLSELALGWSTYGVGDQMSHYNVNGGVPKTLIQHLIRWVISVRAVPDEVDEVLRSVLDTEITPELVPTGEDEELQSSEAKIGPYALQDFSLFQVLRYGFRPSKIAFLAWHAWSDAENGNWPPGFPEDKRPAYTLKEIRHWLQVFVQRFYSFSQFKRSALPNGPKVSHGGALSPRGDWRAPSDMSARAWLDEIEREIPED